MRALRVARIEDTPASEAPASKVRAKIFCVVGSRSQSLPSQAVRSDAVVVVVVVVEVLVVVLVVVVFVVLLDVVDVVVLVLVDVRVEEAEVDGDAALVTEPLVDGDVADWLAVEEAVVVGEAPESLPGVPQAVTAVRMTAVRHRARHLMSP